jgi:hypothetical protein
MMKPARNSKKVVTMNWLERFPLRTDNETGKRDSRGRFLDFYAANVLLRSTHPSQDGVRGEDF